MAHCQSVADHSCRSDRYDCCQFCLALFTPFVPCSPANDREALGSCRKNQGFLRKISFFFSFCGRKLRRSGELFGDNFYKDSSFLMRYCEKSLNFVQTDVILVTDSLGCREKLIPGEGIQLNIDLYRLFFCFVSEKKHLPRGMEQPPG